MSNTNVGRHSIGAPIAKSGIRPPKKRGQAEPASNKFKTAAKPQYSGVNTNYKTSPEQIIKQAPEPFRNPQATAKPTVGGTKESGTNNAYSGIGSNRISTSIDRSTPQRNVGAVGISGSQGMGSNNGKVADKSQPRKVGNVFKQPKASFYGR